ncbi:ion transporter [Deferribacterales bacterium Es71-Z0220]|uniref:ion transporter n=1 Tax=Deferrivibrio essentukiensis TaxID=2880922 RepID=UPI001F61CEEA|nr:ion transporter [Deferrivibrio essentukiensis]MCB4205052.1 ion transporter [Deferrivibrio essentukiensis]
MTLRKKLYEIIFEAETKAGKLFDVVLLISICISILVVILQSVESIHVRFGSIFYAMEWFFTILFTIEYGLRIYTIEKPIRYIRSFYGIVDLLAILPTYLELFLAGTHFLLVVRALRLLRVFRILKLTHYVNHGSIIVKALKASRFKIVVFLFAVVNIVIIVGSAMYVIEGGENGFTSIPRSIYWAIVTLTTVGYGDISPSTPLGQFIASMLMIIGYGVIAVPTGIVTSEMTKFNKPVSAEACPACGQDGHDVDAKFCKYCGYKL